MRQKNQKVAVEKQRLEQTILSQSSYEISNV